VTFEDEKLPSGKIGREGAVKKEKLHCYYKKERTCCPGKMRGEGEGGGGREGEHSQKS